MLKRAVVFPIMMVLIVAGAYWWISFPRSRNQDEEGGVPESATIVDVLIPAEATEFPEGVKINVEYTEVAPVADQLTMLIPEWLQSDGVMHRERVQVGGKWVERARSRYEWGNGSEIEIEVTDLGENADEELLKSLGFNLDIDSVDDGVTLRKRQDGEGYLSNLEYDQENMEGMVQYAIHDRYLLEVQLQGLPLESFQILEEQHGVFRALLAR